MVAASLNSAQLNSTLSLSSLTVQTRGAASFQVSPPTLAGLTRGQFHWRQFVRASVRVCASQTKPRKRKVNTSAAPAASQQVFQRPAKAEASFKLLAARCALQVASRELSASAPSRNNNSAHCCCCCCRCCLAGRLTRGSRQGFKQARSRRRPPSSAANLRLTPTRKVRLQRRRRRQT